MLRAYFDDSGTHKESPVVVLGGLLGLPEDWEKLEDEWREKLSAPMPGKPSLKAFHLSHCVGHFDEFEVYSFAECESLRHDFRQIILSSNLRQISLAIPRADWDEIVVPPYREIMGTAEEACFVQFIEHSMAIVRPLKSANLKIAYVYDIGRASERLEFIASLFKKYAAHRPEFGSFSWGKVKDMPPLQAADTIATEAYWAVQKWIDDGDLENTSAHSKQLLGGMAGEGQILDREAIQAEINRRGPDGKLR